MRRTKIFLSIIIAISFLTGCSADANPTEDTQTPQSETVATQYNLMNEKLLILFADFNKNLPNYEIIQGRLSIQSTEGNSFTAYMNDGTASYTLSVMGEMGNTEVFYYNFAELIYIEKVNTTYNVPFYIGKDDGTFSEAFDPEKSKVETQRIVVDNGECFLLNIEEKTLTEAGEESKEIYLSALNNAQLIESGKYKEVIEEIRGVNVPAVYYEDFEEPAFPLIASIPEKDIYLYAIKNNNSYSDEVVLYYGNTGHYYDMYFGTPRFYMPELWLHDFDGDGTQELAVANYCGSGTGISIEGLNIIRIDRDNKYNYGPWSICTFSPDDYLSQINSQISYRKSDDKDDEFILSIAGTEHTVKIDPYYIEEGGGIRNMCVDGYIVDFYCEDNVLKGKFAFSSYSENFATPDFIGEVYADCVFSEDNDFRLENIVFESY